MKELKIETGGRPYRNDDFELMQTETLDSFALMLADHVATIGGRRVGFILSGCQRTGGTLTEGMVYLNGRLLRVAATSGVNTAGCLVMEAIESDPRLYRNGVTKNCAVEYRAVYAASEPANPNERIAYP
jgi:hypothetical protein